jgi:hypothetical protein
LTKLYFSGTIVARQILCLIPFATQTGVNMASELVKVSFHGDIIEAIQDERGVWASIRRICEGLGVTTQSQLAKLKNKPWAVITMIVTTGPDGKQYENAMISLDSLPMWLATIEPSRVKEEVRPKLERYQKECAKVLAEHFLGQRKEPAVNWQEIETKIIDTVASVIEKRFACQQTWTVDARLIHKGWCSTSARLRDRIKNEAVRRCLQTTGQMPNVINKQTQFRGPDEIEALDSSITKFMVLAIECESGGLFAATT